MIFKIAGEVVKKYQVPRPEKGRQWVIPDIHGCVKTFKALIEKINLCQDDQLFLLGDYINRGPDNPGVLNYIFDLIDAGFQVYPLRGNHEQMALDAYKKRKQHPEEGLFVSIYGKPKGIVDENLLLLPQYAKFFDSLPYYYELDNCFLVHAGFDFHSPWPFRDYDPMIWIKDFISDPRKTKGKPVIRGHVTYPLDQIKAMVREKASVIHLDGGCYKKTEPGKGMLCCLDVTSHLLLYQENIESKEI
ncbi:MAG: metallophosphoesterase family protein [Bacteroidota bacterium]